MTDLMALAAQMAPCLTLAAASMGQSFLNSVQTRIADSAVERGRLFLERALKSEDTGEETQQTEATGETGETDVPAREVREVRDLVEKLSAADRAALETALGQWLADPDGRDDVGRPSAAVLERHIRRQAALVQSGPVTFSVQATGPGAQAFGQVVGDVHGGYRPEAGDGR
ncbi:hypothetical protein CLM62_21770 [Streptomyces sp. SA15]|uniref:hypothetical protein n=1 Tax=Streptomyces sp. SA15 TaxID=934019 RepID=UPI000BB00C2B|nr:hypothetical protein [Streptomyces sp. SA15]PAZ14076.1 hypothetical protein CLM62_21770 [Streptomyces sp. SA15]